MKSIFYKQKDLTGFRNLLGLVVACAILFLSSCTPYLDVVPDNTTTLEDIFLTRTSTLEALGKVYNNIPHFDHCDYSPFGLGDEYLGPPEYNNSTTDNTYFRIMRGLQTTDNPFLGFWSGTRNVQHLYKALNLCEVFLHYVDGVRDMTETEIREWKAQVKFMKAYYLWTLVQYYGPVVIPPAKMLDPGASTTELFLPRTGIEECFTHIISLINEAMPDLKERVSNTYLGQVDQIVAKAMKARILFYRASPFYNGNSEYYANFLDANGNHFFPQQYDREKWKAAIDAIDEAIAIAHANGKRLYTFKREPYLFDREDYELNGPAIQTMMNNRMVVCDPWNEELLWGFSGLDITVSGFVFHIYSQIRLPQGYENQSGTTPNNSAYARPQLCATAAAVDRFYSKNGLPMDEDLTVNQDALFNVVVTPGMENADGTENPDYTPLRGIMQPGAETVQMYLDREPRFYANLGITGGYWRTHDVRISTQMYAESVGGYNADRPRANDYYVTGVAVKKLVHPNNKGDAWQMLTPYPYPIIRLADLYLMKAEALNEYGDGPTEEVYEMVNRVRRRAGIPDVETVWGNPALARTVGKHGTQAGMREIILRERANEFAFEGQYFWDCIRTKRAISEFSKNAFGWTHDATTGEAFFVRQAKQARIFTVRDCLWPIPLDELNINSNLVQNPYW